MRQTTELTRVKSRIKALAEKTVSNGCTEAEAMTAAEMVGRLLERYALSMEEIDVREERCVQIAVPIGGKQRRPIDGCVTAIARFCDCKVWISRDDATPSYIFSASRPTRPWPAICSRSLTVRCGQSLWHFGSPILDWAAFACAGRRRAFSTA